MKFYLQSFLIFGVLGLLSALIGQSKVDIAWNKMSRRLERSRK